MPDIPESTLRQLIELLWEGNSDVTRARLILEKIQDRWEATKPTPDHPLGRGGAGLPYGS